MERAWCSVSPSVSLIQTCELCFRIAHDTRFSRPRPSPASTSITGVLGCTLSISQFPTIYSSAGPPSPSISILSLAGGRTSCRSFGHWLSRPALDITTSARPPTAAPVSSIWSRDDWNARRHKKGQCEGNHCIVRSSTAVSSYFPPTRSVTDGSIFAVCSFS